MPEISERKRKQIVAYRNKKGLCNYCGCIEEGEPHTCYENYVKSDMRERELPTEDVLEIRHFNIEVEEEVVEEVQTEEEKVINHDELPELTSKMKTIVSYRNRKSLCVRCGSVDANITNDHDCEEDYTEADRRSEEEKLKDPRTVITPKEKIPTIEETQQDKHINNIYINNSKSDFYRLKKNKDIEAQRKFIIVDITKSEHGQKITLDYLKFLNGKYKNMIIYTVGEWENTYSYKEYIELRKILNICPISNIMDQNIVNHLHGCERFFGFPSRYATYCLCYNLPSTIFFDNTDGFNIPCTIVDIKNDKDVDRDLVMTNVSSWKV